MDGYLFGARMVLGVKKSWLSFPRSHLYQRRDNKEGIMPRQRVLSFHYRAD